MVNWRLSVSFQPAADCSNHDDRSSAIREGKGPIGDD
jgi:hypothetical protein